MYANILIATDGSELASKGVEEGLNLAKAVAASVSVLSVEVPASGMILEALVEGGALDIYERGASEEQDEIEASVAKMAADAGVKINFLRAIDTVPADAILRTASELGCDLIVITSHGRHGLSRLMLGSQTAKVLAHAAIPVLVIR